MENKEENLFSAKYCYITNRPYLIFSLNVTNHQGHNFAFPAQFVQSSSTYDCY